MHSNPVCESGAESSAASAALARLSNEEANSTTSHAAASIHALIDQPTRWLMSTHSKGVASVGANMKES